MRTRLPVQQLLNGISKAHTFEDEPKSIDPRLFLDYANWLMYWGTFGELASQCSQFERHRVRLKIQIKLQIESR